jgi:hypothetical protein
MISEYRQFPDLLPISVLLVLGLTETKGTRIAENIVSGAQPPPPPQIDQRKIPPNLPDATIYINLFLLRLCGECREIRCRNEPYFSDESTALQTLLILWDCFNVPESFVEV